MEFRVILYDFCPVCVSKVRACVVHLYLVIQSFWHVFGELRAGWDCVYCYTADWSTSLTGLPGLVVELFNYLFSL